MRSTQGYAIAGRKQYAQGWIGTKHNPSDDPTRCVKRPSPNPPPDSRLKLYHTGPPPAEWGLKKPVAATRAMNSPMPAERGADDTEHALVPQRGVAEVGSEDPALKPGVGAFWQAFAGKGGLTAACRRG